jgi:hypothetical protein
MTSSAPRATPQSSTFVDGTDTPNTSFGDGELRKRVIIVAPHFAPSNLASVHRSRLFAIHLPEFGWDPIIVTVHHRYYEEALDWNLTKLLPAQLRVEAVSALPTTPLRIVGDIGVRGFAWMLKRILSIADREQVDFLYVTIPSFFAAPLGRLAYHLRDIPYGIDYIDPWVGEWPGTKKRLTRAWTSRKLADVLEPFSVKHASLITGVTKGSYDDVFVRNPRLAGRVTTAAMPYGGEANDHVRAASLGLKPYLFDDDDKFRVVYAGSMWDSAEEPLDRVFRSIAANRALFKDVRFHFIGTGRAPTNPEPQIRPLAERYGIWGDIIVEHPRRIPYLDVLAHLEAANAVFIFGSTQPHYTPSKLYQGVLSKKPILAVLHQASTASTILEQTRAGLVLSFDGAADLDVIETGFAQKFSDFREFSAQFRPSQVSLREFESYSARSVTRMLAEAMNQATHRGHRLSRR